MNLKCKYVLWVRISDRDSTSDRDSEALNFREKYWKLIHTVLMHGIKKAISSFVKLKNGPGFSGNGGKAKNSCQDVCIRVSHNVEAYHTIHDEASIWIRLHQTGLAFPPHLI
ncbi:hypothetical protein EO93_13830 [Methanosarcina sp. 1.H.A.2.2]|nr:hypothetical protein EO93_13830 [Methanosarcina sp. 1.H.A.2.2]